MAGKVLPATLLEKYLEELEKDEAAMEQAADAYVTAKAQIDMGLQRYAALRDYLTEQIGRSPYARDVRWPSDSKFDPPTRGRYRFAGMKVGDAILQLLRERRNNGPTEWMTLSMLTDALSGGGLGFPDGVQARAINAALQAFIKGGTVKQARNRDGVPLYSDARRDDDEGEGDNGDGEGDIDPDDMPF